MSAAARAGRTPWAEVSVHVRMNSTEPVAHGGGMTATQVRADATARRNAVTGITGVVTVALLWATAEAARALDFPERKSKAVIAAVVALMACGQIVLGVMMTILPLGRTGSLRRIHRILGAVALVGGGFVTYLCMTGPFPGGPTLHRMIGFIVVAVVLIKIPVVTNIPHRRALVVTLGILLGVGLISAFITNGLDVLRTWS
jgi:hypothetical protein